MKLALILPCCLLACLSCIAQDIGFKFNKEKRSKFRSDFGLMSGFTKELRLQDNPKCYWATGLGYQSVKSNDFTGQFRNFRQANIPLYYGRKLSPHLSVEAGLYAGVHLNNPVNNLWFQGPEGGFANWRSGLATGLMLSMFWKLPGSSQLQLQYRDDDYADYVSLGRVQLGCSVRF